MRWVGLGLAVILHGICPRLASAESERTNVARLSSSKDYKVRLSAALSLARSTSPRAILAVSRALAADSQATVRHVAALSLSRMITSSTRSSVKDKAVAALERAAKKDASSKVRRAALATLGRLEAVRSPAKKLGPVFLHVGSTQDTTRKLSRGARSALESALSSTIARLEPKYAVETNKGALPSQAELMAAQAHGFYIGASVASLEIRKMGARAEVRCAISVRISPWSGRDGHEKLVSGSSASASGSARVLGSGSSSGIESSQRDCVVAVAEEVTSRQVVPFLKHATK